MEMDESDSLQNPALLLQSSSFHDSDPDSSATSTCCVVNLMSSRNSCSDPDCSSDYPSSHHVTSQCTDQCVVITCDDSNHMQGQCDNYADVCGNSDCGGLDEFLQCCTDYHSYLSDPKAMNYQANWDPSLEQFLCSSCDHPHSHHHGHPQPSTADASSTFSLPTMDDAFQLHQNLPSMQNPVPITPISPVSNPHVDFGFTSIPSSLPEQNPSNNETLSIACMWGSCDARFASPDQLVTHVNTEHLQSGTPFSESRPPSTPPSHSHSHSAPHTQKCENQHKFSCLWRDCHEFFPDLMPEGPPSDRPHAPLDDLAIHILSHHLGYPGPNLPPLPRYPQDYPKDYPTPSSEHSFPQQSDSGIIFSEGEISSASGTPPPAYDVSRQSPFVQHPHISPLQTNLSSRSKGKAKAADSDEHACLWQDCQETFTTCDELTNHLALVHIGSGKAHYECFWKDCSRNGQKGFTSKQKICRHLQSHTGHRPFQCKLCNQNFSEAATLQQHMRRHTQEKPYVCDYPGCGKSFAITGALTIHKRTHNGHKPFKCTYCERAFAESSNLSKHLRTHTGARPYPCLEPGCNKSFARPDQLNRHMNVHRKKQAAASSPGSS
ncbi:zinc-finger protein [Stygiomarasmius scandens]|uniref:Zinc-finger protein n=1 Tax=Marasmiellus scandens TaxID=2682957 RepID=A0ABR1ISE7_9AGAR